MNNEEKLNLKKLIFSIKNKNLFLRYVILSCTIFVAACSFNLLEMPINLVTGGTTGIAIILEHLFDLNPSITILSISSVLIVFSFIILGLEKTSASLFVTFIFPLFIELTSNIQDLIYVNTSDMVLISIFVGLISGLVSGINFKIGFGNGGLSIIPQIIYKYNKTSIASVSFFINGIIVLIGGIFFGWTMVMYAIIVLFINNIVTDRVLLGISKNKSLYIMTKKESEVKEYILNVLGHGVTEFNVKGGFELNKRHALMTVIPNSDYFKLKEGVNEIDQNAFFIVTDSYQLNGGE